MPSPAPDREVGGVGGPPPGAGGPADVAPSAPRPDRSPPLPRRLATLPAAIRQDVEAWTRCDSTGLRTEVTVGGAIAVDLEDRFRRVPVAVVDADGAIAIHEY